MNEAEEVSAELPGGTKIRARGYDALTIVLVVAMTAFGSILWQHMEDTKRVGHELVITQKEMARSIKLSACIQATDQDKKEREYMRPDSFCNRVSQ